MKDLALASMIWDGISVNGGDALSNASEAEVKSWAVAMAVEIGLINPHDDTIGARDERAILINEVRNSTEECANAGSITFTCDGQTWDMYMEDNWADLTEQTLEEIADMAEDEAMRSWTDNNYGYYLTFNRAMFLQDLGFEKDEHMDTYGDGIQELGIYAYTNEDPMLKRVDYLYARRSD